MAGPIKEDLDIYQGDTFEFFFRLRDETVLPDGNISSVYRDLTGFTVKAQIKAAVNGALIAEFVASVPPHEITPGSVLLTLPPSITSGLPVGYNIGVWDVQLTSPDGIVKTHFRGSVNVEGDVTE